MVYVRLEREWTDSDGRNHEAGAMVDVDASTLAALEAQGVVEDASEKLASGGWSGPSGDSEPASGGWSGPSGGSEPASGGWSGPSGDGDS